MTKEINLASGNVHRFENKFIKIIDIISLIENITLFLVKWDIS